MNDRVHQAYIAIGEIQATYGEGMYMGEPKYPSRYYRQKENFEAIIEALDDLCAENERLRRDIQDLKIAHPEDHKWG